MRPLGTLIFSLFAALGLIAYFALDIHFFSASVDPVNSGLADLALIGTAYIAFYALCANRYFQREMKNLGRIIILLSKRCIATVRNTFSETVPA